MSQLAAAWNRAKAHYASKSAPEPAGYSKFLS